MTHLSRRTIELEGQAGIRTDSEELNSLSIS